MTGKEKRAARREEEQRILRQMTEKSLEEDEGERGVFTEEAAPDKAASAPSPRSNNEKAVGGYTPMTDEQIKKVRLVLWPILLIIALLVYLSTHGFFS